MKKRQIVHLAVIVLALVAVVILSCTLRSNTVIDCADCGGAGAVATLCDACGGQGCAECSQTGAVRTVCGSCEGKGTVAAPSRYYATFMALVPPIIAIGLALITKEVFSSLFVGVVAGGLFYANYNPVGAMNAIVGDGIVHAVSGQAGIFVFLVVLGVIVSLLNKSGGSRAFGRWAQKHVKTRVGAMLATFALGVLIFVDDYFNCLTVGSVMRPVTDTHKISRAKLAYLIDATAAPICMIAPVSSWAAAVSQYVEDGQGLAAFVRAIPYNYYSLLTIVFIIAISLMGFDYGKMAGFEFNAREKGELGAQENPEAAAETHEDGSRVLDLVFPIVVLIISCIGALLYVGGFFTAGEYQWQLAAAFGNTDASVGLPWGSVIALVVIVVYMICRKRLTFHASMKSIPEGFTAMVPAILILTLASALKNMTALLGSDVFVARILENAGALKSFLPAIIFLIACFLAFATGTSWGTFGILIPIVQAGIGLNSELGVIAMSACLAGAVFGDHCSPISDTSIMASAGAQCNHLDHVTTQFPYAVTVAAVSFVTYILSGFVQNWMITLPVAVALMLGTLFVLRAVVSRQKNAENQ